MQNDSILFFHSMPYRYGINSMSDGKTVDYTETLYNDIAPSGQRLTYEQYRQANPNEQFSAPMPWHEIAIVIENHEQTEYLDPPPHEITEAEYWEMLECLPPERWTRLNNSESFFLMCEYTTSDITSAFYKHGERYFTANVRARWSDEKIVARFEGCTDE